MLITHFADQFALAKTERSYNADELVALIAAAHAPAKDRLPWLKGARFGDVRSDRGSLRHDRNVIQVTGVEGDYDGGEMEFDAAWERLALIGCEAVLYTSPSHTPLKPRWRVVCPLSRPYPPAERAKFVSWINGLLGGVLADESFALSQSYYFGHLDGCAEFRVEHIRGTPLDELEELAQIAIGRKSGGNGPNPTGQAGQGAFDETALLAQIVSGAAFHRPAIRLVGKWARDGLAMLEAKFRLEAAFDQIPEAGRDARWRQRRGPDLAKILDDIYGKEAGKAETAPHVNHSKGTKSAEPQSWLEAAQKSTKGQVLNNLTNAVLALQNDPEFKGKLRHNEMLRSPVDGSGEPIEDLHVFAIHKWMQDNGLSRIGLDVVREAVELAASYHRFHPLRDWLGRLQWDGVPRTAAWLASYLGTAEDDYTRVVGQLFLGAMVARIFEPGCQADYMLVLEGPQGELKSQACRLLAGEYFSDHLPDLAADPVRVSMHLRGKWLIEVAELSAFSRAEATALKSFLTRQVEQFIPKYGRFERHEGRQCCFVGTTNDDQYLKDETGNRRFWPVKCGAIDLEGLGQARDQLFAETVQAYFDGAPWWPDREFERQYIKPMQEVRLWVDAWQAPIAEFLETAPDRFPLIEVAEKALDFVAARLTVTDQKRIAALLRQAGCESFHAHRGKAMWRRRVADDPEG